MRGPRILIPGVTAAAASVAAAMLPALTARAADFDQSPALGQPVVLFSRDAPAATPTGFVRGAAATASTRRPAVPVQRKPLDAKPLIPPAPVVAKLAPPPPPRPALSLETDLQPLSPPPSVSSAGSKAPPG